MRLTASIVVTTALLLIALLSVSSCRKPPQPPPDPDTVYDYGYQPRNPPWGTIDVWATMLVRRPITVETEDGYAERLENNVELTRKKFDETNRFWDFFALNETYYAPGNEGRRHNSMPIRCPSVEMTPMATMECFDVNLRDSNEHLDHMNNLGSVAFLGNRDSLTMLPGTVRQKYLEGKWNGLCYPLTGARFRISRHDNPELIVPLYSIKLPTSSANGEHKMSQVNDLITQLKDVWWVGGDLTPVVVGDVNFNHMGSAGSESQNLAEEMKKYFFEAGMVVGGAGIETIWVGKEESFPGAMGTMAIIERDYFPDFDDIEDPKDPNDTGKISDHQGLHGRLQARVWGFHKIMNTAPVLATSNDGPCLFATQNRLYLAWSDTSPDMDIHITQSTPAHPDQFENAWEVYKPDSDEPIGSNYTPALTYFNNRFILAWVDDTDFTVNVMAREAVTPSSQGWVDHMRYGNFSDHGPALVAAGDTLWLAWKEQGGGRIYYAKSTDGMGWSGPIQVPVNSFTSPALAYYQGNVFMAWIGDNQNRIYIQQTADNGSSWIWYVPMSKKFSPAAPALMALHEEDMLPSNMLGPPMDSLYLMWSGNVDRHIRVLSSPDGRQWDNAKRVTEHSSTWKPSLVYFNYQHIFAWTDDNTRLIHVKGTPIGGEISIDKIYE